MKRELLALAKERRQQQSKQFKPLSKLQLSKKQQSEPSLNEQQYFDDDQQQYEPSDEQILGYAEFIGIKLPEEEDLLYIARDGLLADLPEDWQEHETQDGNIIYINTRTEEITGEHPCDDYFRKLVIKQRNKRGANSKNKYVGIQPIGNSMPQQKQSIGATMGQPRKDIDPLVKMEMEKKKKKLEEQKRKEFEDRKKQITAKYEKKREDLETDLRAIQKRLRKRYDQQIQSQKAKMSKKMSEQEKSHQERKRKQIEKFERELRSKLEKKYFDKRIEEKDKMEKKMKSKRQQIRQGLQGVTKSKKKQLEEQFKQKLKILSDKEKDIMKEQTDQQIFDKQVNKIKEEIVQKRIKQYGQKLQSERVEQEKYYKAKLAQLQKDHQQTLKRLEEEAPDNQIKFDVIAQQVELFEKQQLQAFEYEISKTKQLKKVQKQYQLEKYKKKLMSQHRQNLQILDKETENLQKKYRRLKQQEFRARVSDTEKKLNEEYLYSMKQFKKKFENEQQIIQFESKPLKRNTDLQKHSLEMINQTISNLNRKQQTLRTQLETIRDEISRISKGYKPFAHKLTQQQNRMFELIKNHLDSRKGSQKFQYQ